VYGVASTCKPKDRQFNGPRPSILDRFVLLNVSFRHCQFSLSGPQATPHFAACLRATAGTAAGNDPRWELVAQPLPQIEFDLR
jgi:hypothetical protein